MRNSHLQGKIGNGIVLFLKTYKFEGNGVTYLPGDYENFELTTARNLAIEGIVKLSSGEVLKKKEEPVVPIKKIKKRF